MIRSTSYRLATIRARHWKIGRSHARRTTSSISSPYRGVKERLVSHWNDYPHRKIAEQIKRYHPDKPMVIDDHAIIQHIPSVIFNHEFERDYHLTKTGLLAIAFGSFGLYCEDDLIVDVSRDITIGLFIPITLLLISPVFYHIMRLKQLRYLRETAQQKLGNTYPK